MYDHLSIPCLQTYLFFFSPLWQELLKLYTCTSVHNAHAFEVFNDSHKYFQIGNPISLTFTYIHIHIIDRDINSCMHTYLTMCIYTYMCMYVGEKQMKKINIKKIKNQQICLSNATYMAHMQISYVHVGGNYVTIHVSYELTAISNMARFTVIHTYHIIGILH